MTKLFVEWCQKPQSRNSTFIPIADLSGRSGFRSVYAFKEQPSSSKGLSQYPVYSDVLFLDFDDGLSNGFKKLTDFLKAQGIGFSSYSSGSKGGHLHVPITPMEGHNVPYSQKTFIQQLDCGADISLYRHSSLFRLEGTVHDKTGRKKELIETFKGALLEIDMLEPPVSKFAKLKPVDEDPLKLGFIRFTHSINEMPENGNRTNTLWSLARNFSDAGLSFDSALELLQLVNESWSDPKEDSEVLRAVTDGYK